jgi:uncharacterized protein (DUF488 family)
MPERAGDPPPEKRARRPFFTIGHSNRSLEEFASLLQAVRAEVVADVRKLPRSRANPQFNIEVLPSTLSRYQIDYRHIAALGGLRGRSPNTESSPNGLWRNRSFRNYADYALTPAFRAGLAELTALGGVRTCAVMCSEAVWWRCHRRIIADYLLWQGAVVFHVLGPANVTPAAMTPGGEKTASGLLYPGGEVVGP